MLISTGGYGDLKPDHQRLLHEAPGVSLSADNEEVTGEVASPSCTPLPVSS